MSEFMDKANEKGYIKSENPTGSYYLDITSKIGNFAFFEVIGEKEVEFIPKTGKMQGKLVKQSVFLVSVSDTNLDIPRDVEITLNPPGLLRYQLNQRKTKYGFPFFVGVEYNGKDEEGRHQTSIVDKKTEKNNGEVPF